MSADKVENINPEQNQMATWLRELADDMQNGKVVAVAVAAVFAPEAAVERGKASMTLQMSGADRYNELCLIGELEYCKARLLGLVLFDDLEDLDED